MMNLKNNFKNKEEDDECRFCHKEKETTEHIMLACERLNKLRGSSTISEDDLTSDNDVSIQRLLQMKKQINLLIKENNKWTM